MAQFIGYLASDIWEAKMENNCICHMMHMVLVYRCNFYSMGPNNARVT